MTLLAAGGPHDYSLYNMFMTADPVVQFVMVGLMVASVACWAIILEKLIRLLWLGAQVRRLEAAARNDRSTARPSPSMNSDGFQPL